MKRKSKAIAKPLKKSEILANGVDGYDDVLNGVVELLESARRTSARATNAIMTATYWEVGRRIVECEQAGESRAAYGEALLERLSTDLSQRFGRGFSQRNIRLMRAFFSGWPIRQTVSAELGKGQSRSGFFDDSDSTENRQTPSAESGSGNIVQTPATQPPIFQTLSGKFDLRQISTLFPLPWSHYVRLLQVEKPAARRFYETEALRGGWSVRQLDRQVSTSFYERTLASRNKTAMLEKGEVPLPTETLSPEQEIKDPLVLEFLGLKDEYSESDLENALVEKLEEFLLELGGDFTFVGRQRRLRIDDEWYRIDLLFFHRGLRCLVVIDLKIGKFTHADAGQMLMYLGYAAEHWTRPDENPPVGLVLCAQHNHAVAHYTLDRLPDKVLAAEYRLALPDEATLTAELERVQSALASRGFSTDEPTKTKTSPTKKKATNASAKSKSSKRKGGKR